MSGRKVQPGWYGEDKDTGFKELGEVQWGYAFYDFDLTRVWVKEATGALFGAHDSGCSCPSPFEDTTTDDLKPIRRLADLDELIKSDSYGDPRREEDLTCPVSVDEYARLREKVAAHLQHRD